MEFLVIFVVAVVVVGAILLSINMRAVKSAHSTHPGGDNGTPPDVNPRPQYYRTDQAGQAEKVDHKSPAERTGQADRPTWSHADRQNGPVRQEDPNDGESMTDAEYRSALRQGLIVNKSKSSTSSSDEPPGSEDELYRDALRSMLQKKD